MSTNNELLIQAGITRATQEITVWEPSRPILHRSAFLCLTEQPRNLIERSWSDQQRESLRGKTKAAFDFFTETGCPPYIQFKKVFGKTGIAQMQVLSPKPGIRLFGGFIKNGSCFLGLKLLFRDELPFKATQHSGKIDYRSLGEALTKEWSRILPETNPFVFED